MRRYTQIANIVDFQNKLIAEESTFSVKMGPTHNNENGLLCPKKGGSVKITTPVIPISAV